MTIHVAIIIKEVTVREVIVLKLKNQNTFVQHTKKLRL